MFKYILRLLAASTSLVALLLVTNSAIAATPSNNSPAKFSSTTISLNVISPSLQLNKDSDTSSQHLGCTCPTCMQTDLSQG